jgi:transcription initiation factor TFIIB
MGEKVIQKEMPEKCPECGSINLLRDSDTGEITCGNCGLVLDERTLDDGAEWRAYSQEEKEERSRVGMPESLFVHDKSLTTTLKPIHRDSSGKPIKDFFGMKRLAKLQDRSKVHSALERNLVQALTELDRLTDKCHLPSQIKEMAATIYRKALEKGLARGRAIMALIAACLYAACRQAGIPRTLDEIAKASLVTKKEIRRCYNLLVRELELQMPLPKTISYLSKIAERIGISGKTQGKAIEILYQTKKKHLSWGKNPIGIAAGALYIACELNNEMINYRGYSRPVTQKDIAEAAGVTEVTVRNRYKELVKELNIKIPTKSEKIRSFLFFKICYD